MSDELKGLNLVELLGRMADISAPAPVSYWPQTSGWIVIGVAVLLTISALGWRMLGRRKADQYRRQALKELDMIASDKNNSTAQLTEIARVLRRVALVSFPRKRVAALFGDDWLGFLDQTGTDVGFTEGPGRLLATVPYTEDVKLSALERRAVHDMAVKWITTHRTGAKVA